jgi:hypothetical protein
MSDLPEALRQREAALAILECAVTRETVAQWSEVRLRAERRAGEVLNEVIEAGMRQSDTTAFANLLDAHGVRRRQASRWQSLAYMPPDVFERAVVKRIAIATAGMTFDTSARGDMAEECRLPGCELVGDLG